MENYKGRYVKVLRKNLGGNSSLYNTGDYLEVLEDLYQGCITVEYAGPLFVRGQNNRIELHDIEIMPLGFIPDFAFPKKWCVKITKQNIDKAKDLKNKELGFDFNYHYSIDGYYTPFDNSTKCHGLMSIPSDLTEITWEQFETYVLKTPQQISFFPILDKFPEEGCCNTIDNNLIQFLVKNFGITDSKTPSKFAKAIGWNSKSYWYLRGINSSSKPKFDITQLEPFYKQQFISDKDLDVVFKKKKQKQLINKTQSYEHNKSESSTKICGLNFKIRQGDPIRSISLRSSKSKIRIGSNNSYY